MKKSYLIIAMLAAFCSQGFTLNVCQAQAVAARPIALQVSSLKNSGISFKPVNLFKINAADSAEMLKMVNGALPVTMDMDVLNDVRVKNNDAIAFSFPYDNKLVILELYRVNIFTDDFTVVTDQSDGEAISYTPGIYYRGIVQGDEHSLAAVSFFNGEMMGIVATHEYLNINIGKSGKEGAAPSDYIICSDKNLPNFLPECATPNDPDYSSQMSAYAINGASLRTEKCVNIYYELDNNIYTSSGSTTTGAANWMTAVHNNIATLFSNDQITTALSQIFIWTTLDPYNGTTSFDQLAKFKANRPTFNGDVGQLVGIDAGGLGGVASVVNGLCSSSNKYCYADVSYSYNTAPVYSWTVMLCTHELGHLMGSAHTQNCGWPGGAIDNCYATEGGCPAGPAPVNGGTIMSYCYLTSYGTNFANGFGPLPASAIQGAIDAAECLSSAPASTCVIPTSLSASAVTSSSAVLNWYSASDINNCNILYRQSGNTAWLSSSSTTDSQVISGLAANTQYEFEVQSACPSSISQYSSLSYFTTAAAGCTDNYEPNNLKSKSAFIPANTIVKGLISAATDFDYFTFSNTTTEVNIKVSLSNLPANYNLQVFGPSGVKIASSEKGGTKNEEIILNNVAVGNYQLKVLGAKGAFNTTQCYELMAAISNTPFRFPEEETAAVAFANIFPNPTTGNLTVTYTSTFNTAVEIYVSDITGKVMLMQSNDAFNGINNYQFDLNHLNNGIYFMQIKNGTETTHTKFIIGR